MKNRALGNHFQNDRCRSRISHHATCALQANVDQRTEVIGSGLRLFAPAERSIATEQLTLLLIGSSPSHKAALQIHLLTLANNARLGGIPNLPQTTFPTYTKHLHQIFHRNARDLGFKSLVPNVPRLPPTRAPHPIATVMLLPPHTPRYSSISHPPSDERGCL